MMTPEEFKAWRQRLGLSQPKAAAAIGKTRRMIQAYEAGFSSPNRPAPVPLTVELACKWLEGIFMDEFEADVIEAAQDYAHAIEGDKYGPMARQIKRAQIALLDAVADLAAENDGRWQRPAATEVVIPAETEHAD